MVGSVVARAFEIDELETLSSLANQAAIAIENARLQSRLRELAVVAERGRIAREMHDGLVGAAIMIRVLEQNDVLRRRRVFHHSPT